MTWHRFLLFSLICFQMELVQAVSFPGGSSVHQTSRETQVLQNLVQSHTEKLRFFTSRTITQEQKHAHLMHMDGIRGDLFYELLRRGQLPHFEFLLQNSKFSSIGSTVDQSETFKVILSYLTSKLNTTIMGWWEFDRNLYTFRNYWIFDAINYELGLYFPSYPTIFDFLSFKGEQVLSFFNLYRRSVPFDHYSRNFLEGAQSISQNTYYHQAHRTMEDGRALYTAIVENEHLTPRFATSLLAAADEFGHLEGVLMSNMNKDSLFSRQDIEDGSEYCVERAQKKPDIRLEQIFDLIENNDLSTVVVGQDIFSGQSDATKGHFKKIFRSKNGRVTRACYFLPKLYAFEESRTSLIETPQPHLRIASPHYTLGLMLIDMELGRLIHTMRSLHWKDGKLESVTLDKSQLGLANYIRAQRLENSLFESTLFAFLGDHGMTDTSHVMATPATGEVGRYRHPDSLQKPFLQHLNDELGLATLTRDDKTGDREIGVDDLTLPEELAFPHQDGSWVNESLVQTQVDEAHVWSHELFADVKKLIKDKYYKQYKWLLFLRGPIIGKRINKMLDPHRSTAENVLANFYLKGDKPYMDQMRLQMRKFYDRHVRIVYGGGARNNAHLFLPTVKGGVSWEHRPSLEEIESYRGGKNSKQTLLSVLKKTEGVGLIFIRKNNGEISDFKPVSGLMEILVQDRTNSNKGLITVLSDSQTKQLKFSYQVLAGADPLMYGALSDGQFRSYKEWNDLSILNHHYFHNAVAGMGQFLFSSNPSIGDIILMHSQGWNFGDNGGGHGGLHWEEKVVPILLSGPGIQYGELFAYETKGDGKIQAHYPSILDVSPTILSWLGHGDHALSEFAKTDFSEYLKKVQAQHRAECPQYIQYILSLGKSYAGIEAPTDVAQEFEQICRSLDEERPSATINYDDEVEDGHILSL